MLVAAVTSLALVALTAPPGDVRATATNGGDAEPATLTIVRGDRTLYDAAIPDVCDLDCSATASVVDLDADGDPEVVVKAYTNGAHCCWRMGVFYRRPQTDAYGWVVEDWRSTGFALRDLDGDGRPEVVGRDVGFEDLFGPHGDSFSPPSIRHFERDGPDAAGLPAITARYPRVVTENAANARARLRALRRGDDGRALVAAYVADEYLLRRGSVGLRDLRRQAARGVLGTPKETRAFRARLLAILRQFGYR